MRENIWTIILAAGASARFGGIKALAHWQGITLLSRALATAAGCTGSNVIVVTGGHAAEVTAALGHVTSIYNEDWQNGMGSSLAAGIRTAAAYAAAAAIILPVDQPFVTSQHLASLIDESWKHESCILSQDNDLIGPPAAVPAQYFPRLSHLSGDGGVEAILKNYKTLTAPGILRDIDTSSDLKKYAQETFV